MSDPRIEPLARAMESVRDCWGDLVIKTDDEGMSIFAGEPYLHFSEILAALDASPDLALVPREQAALGAAWARAEAALPEGWSLAVRGRDISWRVDAKTEYGMIVLQEASAESLPAALDALAAKLEARR